MPSNSQNASIMYVDVKICQLTIIMHKLTSTYVHNYADIIMRMYIYTHTYIQAWILSCATHSMDHFEQQQPPSGSRPLLESGQH